MARPACFAHTAPCAWYKPFWPSSRSTRDSLWFVKARRGASAGGELGIDTTEPSSRASHATNEQTTPRRSEAMPACMAASSLLLLITKSAASLFQPIVPVSDLLQYPRPRRSEPPLGGPRDVNRPPQFKDITLRLRTRGRMIESVNRSRSEFEITGTQRSAPGSRSIVNTASHAGRAK